MVLAGLLLFIGQKQRPLCEHTIHWTSFSFHHPQVKINGQTRVTRPHHRGTQPHPQGRFLRVTSFTLVNYDPCMYHRFSFVPFDEVNVFVANPRISKHAFGFGPSDLRACGVHPYLQAASPAEGPLRSAEAIGQHWAHQIFPVQEASNIAFEHTSSFLCRFLSYGVRGMQVCDTLSKK